MSVVPSCFPLPHPPPHSHGHGGHLQSRIRGRELRGIWAINRQMCGDRCHESRWRLRSTSFRFYAIFLRRKRSTAWWSWTLSRRQILQGSQNPNGRSWMWSTKMVRLSSMNIDQRGGGKRQSPRHCGPDQPRTQMVSIGCPKKSCSIKVKEKLLQKKKKNMT